MKNHNSIYVRLGVLTLLVGCLGLAWPFAYDFFISDELAPEPDPVLQAQLPTFEDSFIGSNEDISSTPIPMVSVAPTVVKDHLVISGVNIDMPVFLGTSEKILNKGGWLFPNTSRPELGGNTVIFGHRYMYRPPKSNTFWSLDKVNIGDEMTLLWKGREYRYKVFDIKIVEPTDLSVMNRSSDSILTVITCTPIFTTKQRLVVVGSLISVR